MKEIEIHIDLDSNLTAIEQLKATIRHNVKLGVWKQGNRLPMVRELSLELEICANEIKRMLNQLVNEGYLEFMPGTGHYIIDWPKPKTNLNTFKY